MYHHAGIALAQVDGSAEEVAALPEGGQDDIGSHGARDAAIRSKADHDPRR
jgi:hypothetical protein